MYKSDVDLVATLSNNIHWFSLIVEAPAVTIEAPSVVEVLPLKVQPVALNVPALDSIAPPIVAAELYANAQLVAVKVPFEFM